MNTLPTSADADNLFAIYAPDRITRYVSTNLKRMYLGTAPTLEQVATTCGVDKYRKWIAVMVRSILDFAGLSAKFDISQMGLLADMIRSRYPALKVTEFMHFVYLCQGGEYEGFYGNPNGRTLLAQLARYVKVDRERILAGYLGADQSEALQEGSRAVLSEKESAVVNAVLAEVGSPEYQEKYGAWRYEPWGTEMSKAYFVHRTLDAFPGDMTYPQRRRWAKARGLA